MAEITSKIKVFKFGGSSVRDAEQIKQRAELMRTFLGHKALIVISAMGKTTNKLEEVHQDYISNKENGLNALDVIMSEHTQVAEELGLDEYYIAQKLQALVIENLSRIEGEDDKDLIYDQIISLGELFSTTIISEYLLAQDLSAKWMDVRNIIVTDDNYRDAKVDLELSKGKITKKIRRYTQKAQLIITQGYIGRNSQGYTTTLGREGSDYTAAIFAYALNVPELIIWKDVPGILTADPSRFDDASLLEQLSYREAIEMTYFGAKVIHPKTIQPLQNKQIRLQVRSYIDVEKSGTVISDEGMEQYPPIVVIQDNVILLRVMSTDFAFISEQHLSIIFGKMSEYKVQLCVMRNAAISFTLCINEMTPSRLKDFLRSLSDSFSVETTRDLQLITVRHFKNAIVQSLVKDKEILFEETLSNTVQMVVKAKE